jgi:hypothetical protein
MNNNLFQIKITEKDAEDDVLEENIFLNEM